MKSVVISLKIFAVALTFLPLFIFIAAPQTVAAATFGDQICQPDPVTHIGNIPQCINNIYIVAVAAAGFGGVVLFAAAGYMYMIGTTELVAKAKKIITSVIVGMLILFGTYAILNTINPNLTNLALSIPSVTCTAASCPPSANNPGSAPTTPASGGKAGAVNTAVCAINLGSCNVSQMQQCGAWDPNAASAICGRESKGSPAIPSGLDHCVDGNAFSIGLFQINMITSAGGVPACPSGIFVSSNSAKVQTQCLQRNSNGLCTQWNCQLAPNMQSQYNSCVQALSDPATNITQACSLYQSAKGWGPWTTTYNTCTAPAATQ